MMHLKALILSGEIKTFQDLFSYVTIEQVAFAMKCGVDHVKTIMNDNGKVYLKDVFELAEALDMTTHKERGIVMDLWVD